MVSSVAWRTAGLKLPKKLVQSSKFTCDNSMQKTISQTSVSGIACPQKPYDHTTAQNDQQKILELFASLQEELRKTGIPSKT
jgi:hypothetical protein